jgi:hypothetical protein
VDELDTLLNGPRLVWVDVPSWNGEAEAVPGKVLHLQPGWWICRRDRRARG